jgi:hypothetical protein
MNPDAVDMVRTRGGETTNNRKKKQIIQDLGLRGETPTECKSNITRKAIPDD